jgi:radical SAM protein with 4Fe4S-binding SPASM domain
MDFGLFQKVVDELAVIKPLSVGLFFGGESLLHPQFANMMKYAASKKLTFGFNTNGTMLDKFAENIADLEVNWVNVSLEGIGSTNDRIRIGANYEKVRDNILHLLDLRGEKKKPVINLSLTHSTQTDNEIRDFISFWAPLVDHVYVAPCYTEDLKFLNPNFFDRPIKHNRFCTWPFHHLGILWDGTIILCCHDINGQNAIGNIQNNSLAELWNSPKLKDARYKTVKKCYSTLCRSCESWKPSFIPLRECKEGITVDYQNDGIKKYSSFHQCARETTSTASKSAPEP